MKNEKEIEKSASLRKKKRRKAGSFLSFLILLTAAGAAFYFGWIQFRLEQGEYGVIYTKTRGWENKAVSSGQFTWRLEALLPTNLTLHKFKLTPQSLEIHKTGMLPSGRMYGSLVGEEGNFGWEINLEIDYRILPDALPKLLANGTGIEGLDELKTTFKARAESAAASLLNEGVNYVNVAQAEDALKSRLRGIDANIEIISISVTNWRYPDIDLYNQAKTLAQENIRLRQTVMADLEAARMRRKDTEDSNLELLTRYGKLFSAYPILLDFFALEGNPGGALLLNNP
ncbi:MAG: hypothetical protein B0D92_04575 [Spirochaeta sp. LUC14_002_19_P3]|nr:MAG: hypothetical protein B0D92_04575 [Spirochaeta sp. LUC14_002_19_P3]